MSNANDNEYAKYFDIYLLIENATPVIYSVCRQELESLAYALEHHPARTTRKDVQNTLGKLFYYLTMDNEYPALGKEKSLDLIDYIYRNMRKIRPATKWLIESTETIRPRES